MSKSMTIESMGQEILNYRKARNLPSATNLVKTVQGLVRKANELDEAIDEGYSTEQKKEILLDSLVYAIGGLAVNGTLDKETWHELEALVEKNATREFSNPL